MKHTQIKYTILALSLYLGFGLQSVNAQKIFGKAPSQVKMNIVQQSSNKAVYKFKAGKQEAQLTMIKKGGAIGINIKNQACTLGSGKVSIENGKVSLDAKGLHKGTLGIWIFAGQLIGNDGNQALLIPPPPDKNVSTQCRDKCKGLLGGQQTNFRTPAAYLSTGREDPPVCIPFASASKEKDFENKWAEYFNCYYSCMKDS